MPQRAMFKYRWLEETDYPELCDWWKAFRFPAPPQEALPDNGRCGIMISEGGVNVCAGFLYLTNSNFAFVEFVVSNFQYKDKEKRAAAMQVLFAALEAGAKDNGYKLLYSTVKNQSLLNKMKEFGWQQGSQSVEMIKNIN